MSFNNQVRCLLASLLLFMGSFNLYSQTKSVISLPPAENAVSAATAVTGQTSVGIRHDPRAFLAAGERWQVRLSQRRAVSHGGSNSEMTDETAALELKRQQPQEADPGSDALINTPVSSSESTQMVDIVIENDFIGNAVNGWTPPDNGIAVSNNGDLVAVTNSSLRFMDANGNLDLQSDFSDYLSFLDLDGGYFDPRVVFDPVSDKFIMTVINGNSPTNSVVIGFSTTDNPMDSWWFYVFSGAPDDSNNWFDFPSIGLSTNDLYVSGNLFNSSDNFQQALIYQIEKEPGHLGQSIDFVYFSNVNDANGNLDFTVTPISYGYNGSLAPGVFFASTDFFGGTEAMVYYTTNDVDNNPQLEVYSVEVPEYFPTVDALMSGTNQTISTNDTRLLSGYFANEKIHFVLNTASADADWTRIYYGQINTTTQTGEAIRWGLEGLDYAYPAITPIGTAPTSDESVIGFCRTSSELFPQYRVVSVDGDFNFTGSQSVKNGESFVDFNNDTNERWGDYTGITRLHSSDPIVYIAGNYANNNNVLGTWIARIGRQGGVQVPNANFTANTTSILTGESINFTDISTNSPNSWSWNFSGGSPGSSSAQNPTVTYNSPGIYNVSLVAGNAAGNNTETKVGYIAVEEAGSAPISNFTANTTSILEGETVNFSDLSINEPTSWTWSFPGGTPNVSTQQNPTITYNAAGIYNVSLTTSNDIGADNETKTGYIIVESAGSAPVANFTANVTSIVEGEVVSFTDLSANDPTSWIWSFPGGTPNVSTQQNPTIIYNTAGSYNVSLTATNAIGNDNETRTGYITVEVAGSAPTADFLADNTNIFVGQNVNFTDLSSNDPTSRDWSFEGGVPGTSTLTNPIVLYPNEGIFEVSLTSANTFGSDTETRSDYIAVGVSSAIESEYLTGFVLSPNPVSSGGLLRASFSLEQRTALDFYVVDATGKVVRQLLRHNVKSGFNELAFSTQYLPSGTYFLVVQEVGNNSNLHSEVFMVNR